MKHVQRILIGLKLQKNLIKKKKNKKKQQQQQQGNFNLDKYSEN